MKEWTVKLKCNPCQTPRPKMNELIELFQYLGDLREKRNELTILYEYENDEEKKKVLKLNLDTSDIMIKQIEEVQMKTIKSTDAKGWSTNNEFQ